jgi:hypothetical protein
MLIDVDEQVKALLAAGMSKDEALRLVLVSWAICNTDNPYDGMAVASILTEFVVTGKTPLCLEGKVADDRKLLGDDRAKAIEEGKLTKDERAAKLRMKRPCLKCARSFNSDGPYHRICDKCKDTTEWKSGGLVEHSVAQ